MLTNFVPVGVSFRQAGRLNKSVKEETGMDVMEILKLQTNRRNCMCCQFAVSEGDIHGGLGICNS